MIIETFNTFMFWVIVAVTVYHLPLFFRYVYLFIFCKGVSNLRTAPEVNLKIIEMIRQDIAAKGNPEGYTIIDMGSAYGYCACEIAQSIPDAKVIGIDHDYVGVRLANAMVKKRKLKNVHFMAGDFYKTDISQADAIMFYLPMEFMKPMGDFFKMSSKTGALIFSNRFQLEGWEPAEVLQIETKFPRQGRLNVYRK